MLDQGYDVNALPGHRSGQSFLTAAGYDSDFKLIDLLLNYDVDVNYKRKNGNTVLHDIYSQFPFNVGRCNGCGEQYWVEKREKLNKRAVLATTVINKLVLKGAKFSQINDDKETPLASMAMGHSLYRDNWIKDLIAVALNNGEKINTLNESNENVLYRVIKKLQDGHDKNIRNTVKFLLNKGADPLINVKFKWRGASFNTLDAFCLDMNRLSWNEKKTHPGICSPRNVNAFKEYFMGSDI